MSPRLKKKKQVVHVKYTSPTPSFILVANNFEIILWLIYYMYVMLPGGVYSLLIIFYFIKLGDFVNLYTKLGDFENYLLKMNDFDF